MHAFTQDKGIICCSIHRQNISHPGSSSVDHQVRSEDLLCAVLSDYYPADVTASLIDLLVQGRNRCVIYGDPTIRAASSNIGQHQACVVG